MKKVTIEFDPRIAAALNMNNPLEAELRRAILDPRRHPVVHFIGREFGRVVEVPPEQAPSK